MGSFAVLSISFQNPPDRNKTGRWRQPSPKGTRVATGAGRWLLPHLPAALAPRWPCLGSQGLLFPALPFPSPAPDPPTVGEGHTVSSYRVLFIRAPPIPPFICWPLLAAPLLAAGQERDFTASVKSKLPPSTARRAQHQKGGLCQGRLGLLPGNGWQGAPR